ncbi:MAG: hypothetical protein OXD39_15710 [Gemmatimonadetes bacterium]|nr:hypothetical protein [Gemmatimonadota bacterium]
MQHMFRRIFRRIIRRATYPACIAALVGLVLLAKPAPANAQDGEAADVPPVVITGIGILGGFPTGEFGENVKNPGIGLSGNVGYIIPRTPAVIGLDLGYMIYGRERRTEQFSLTIPDVIVDVVTENNIFSMNAFLRLMTGTTAPLRFYVEGVVGFHYLFTSTTIEDLPRLSGEDIASSTNLDDFAFTRGVGGGVLIEVWGIGEDRTPQNRTVRSVSLDVRMRYHDGAEADYLKRGDIVRRSGTAELNITKSTTDLITAHLGIAMDF